MSEHALRQTQKQLEVALRAGRIGTRARSPGPGEGCDVRHYAMAGFMLHANML